LSVKARKIVIAIDGPSGVGKSTVSKIIAECFGYEYIDTGAMYRAVAVAAGDQGLDLTSDVALEEFCKTIKIHFADNGTRIFLNNKDLSERIRTPEAGEQASRSSALPSVREFLVDLQRKMSENTNQRQNVNDTKLDLPTAGLVMEGRDIGTNVFKDADLKIYLDGDADERAARRLGDYKVAKTKDTSVDKVRQELTERDNRDKKRKLAPLAMAGDAVLIDTTELTIDQVVKKISMLMQIKGIRG